MTSCPCGAWPGHLIPAGRTDVRLKMVDPYLRLPLKNMNRVLTTTAALTSGLALLAAPAGAVTPKHAPTIGSTVTIKTIPHVSSSYSVTLLQVYTTELYGGGPSGSHPVIARLRLSDNGSRSLDEDPQQDSAVLLLGRHYRHGQ